MVMHYVMYQDEDPIDVGTLYQLAEKHGKSLQAMSKFAMPSYIRDHPHGLMLIKADDDEDGKSERNVK